MFFVISSNRTHDIFNVSLLPKPLNQVESILVQDSAFYHTSDRQGELLTKFC